MKRSGKSPFKGRQFTAEVILWAVRWYLQFPISYRDLEPMLADRGVVVDHTTLYRWIQAYAPELDKRIRPHLRRTTGSWRVDETYVKVRGCWMYLYRAVDARGQTIDFRLSAKRDTAAARRFFRKARRTIAGYEILAMVRKGQVAAIPVNGMPAQATFIANLFGVAT